jgi:hypothetical protein
MFTVKENLSIRGTTLRYRVESVDVEVSDGTMNVPRIVWDGVDPRDGETLFREIQGARRKPGPAADELEDALDLLDLMLGEGQRISSSELDKAAQAHGVTTRTMKRARKQRCIKSEYVVDPETSVGRWHVSDPAAGFLPPPEPEAEPAETPVEDISTRKKVGKYDARLEMQAKTREAEPKTCACSDDCTEPVPTPRHKYAEGHRP